MMEEEDIRDPDHVTEMMKNLVAIVGRCRLVAILAIIVIIDQIDEADREAESGNVREIDEFAVEVEAEIAIEIDAVEVAVRIAVEFRVITRKIEILDRPSIIERTLNRSISKLNPSKIRR